MNIWIFNHYALTPEMSGGTRHYDFAKELIKRGYSVTIIASSFHYSKHEEKKKYGSNEEYIQENIEGIDFIWLKTPSYFGNGISRVKNMISYCNKAESIIPKLNLSKPDIIIGSSVHLFAVNSAYKLSRKYNTPFIMEVRDLWPQTLIDMGVSKWHPFIIILGFLERYLYKRANEIITSLPFANRYIEKYTSQEKIHWISNGTDITQNCDGKSLQLLDKNKFNILYTGTHGLANNLHVLIEVADKLKANSIIHFTLIGDGPLKESLIKKANDLHLENITFLSSVPKREVFSYLKSANLLYVGLKNLPLYKYGMSMNKVFDYLSAKKPILFVSNIENNIVEIAKAGKVIKNNDTTFITKTIIDFSNMSQKELNHYGENGFKYLELHFSITVLVDRLEKVLIKASVS
jgi:UDP-N-acetylglucosamine:LPS N-acetylglucosamine transferase